MARLRRLLNKPHYIYRPGQAIIRLGRLLGGAKPAGAWEEAVLPWGLPIRYHPAEQIGNSIWRLGLYDLCVSETLWRLLDAGETALDVGANFGHMTSVMAVRVG